MLYTVKLWAYAVQHAPPVRHNSGRNALQVRRFPGGSALPPALESVKIRCEIFEISKLKNRLEKTNPRGYWKNLVLKFWKINFEILSWFLGYGGYWKRCNLKFSKMLGVEIFFWEKIQIIFQIGKSPKNAPTLKAYQPQRSIGFPLII